MGPICFSRFRRKALSTPVTTAVTETEPCSSGSILAPQIVFAFGGNERFIISAAWLTLEPTEKAFFVMHLDKNPPNAGQHTLMEYDIVTIEVKGAKGAALTIERMAPGGMLPSCYVNLG